MTQISVYGADHSLFQSLLNFLNFARGLYALTLNSEQTIETDHDSPIDLSWKTVKVTVTTLSSTTCCIGSQFFVCLILLMLECWNVECCSDLNQDQKFILENVLPVNRKYKVQEFNTINKSDFEELDTKFTNSSCQCLWAIWSSLMISSPILLQLLTKTRQKTDAQPTAIL